MADRSTIVYQSSQVHNPTPSIKTSTTALASDPTRCAWNIQNLDINPLFVCLGNNASTTQFHVVLKGGTVSSDGLGGSVGQEEGCVYTGIVTVFSTGTPSYVVWDM